MCQISVSKCFLKSLTEAASLSYLGSLFHSLGSAIEKALSP